MSKLLYGQNPQISNKDYHGDRKFISSSGLKLLLDDEQAFIDKYIHGKYTAEENAAFSVGTYIHTMILEPHLLDVETAVFPGDRRAKQAYADFVIGNEGRTVITQSEFDMAKAIEKNYKKMELASKMINKGASEQTFCADIMGVPCKVRWDSIGKTYGIDVKTTSFPITAESIEETIHRYDYALSAAFYMAVTRMCGVNLKDFFFLFANKKNHDTILVKATDRLLRIGEAQFKSALLKYNALIQDNKLDLDPKIEIIESSFGG